jgi:hypothetical protein
MGRCLAAGHVSAKEWSSTVIRLILKPQTRQPLVTIYSLLDTNSFQLDCGRLGDAGGLWMHRSGYWGTRDNYKFKLLIVTCARSVA